MRQVHCRSLFCLAGAVITAGCGPLLCFDPPVPEGVEAVMSPGMSITAVTPSGTMTITAGEGVMRSFTWEGATRCVDMDPHMFGGLYYPGPGAHWEEHNGICRAVVGEFRADFGSVEAAIEWFHTYRGPPFVYRDDGLGVSWDKTLGRGQLNVDIVQVYINGEKPTELEGSRNEAITVGFPQEALATARAQAF